MFPVRSPSSSTHILYLQSCSHDWLISSRPSLRTSHFSHLWYFVRASYYTTTQVRLLSDPLTFDTYLPSFFFSISFGNFILSFHSLLVSHPSHLQSILFCRLISLNAQKGSKWKIQVQLIKWLDWDWDWYWVKKGSWRRGIEEHSAAEWGERRWVRFFTFGCAFFIWLGVKLCLLGYLVPPFTN